MDTFSYADLATVIRVCNTIHSYLNGSGVINLVTHGIYFMVGKTNLEKNSNTVSDGNVAYMGDTISYKIVIFGIIFDVFRWGNSLVSRVVFAIWCTIVSIHC